MPCRPLPPWLATIMTVSLAVLATSSVQAAGFSHLQELGQQGYQISAQARLLGDSAEEPEILGSITPEKLLTPASVTKVYTAAAILDALGPQYRFTTTLKSTARPTGDGVLNGDLILDGGGDPGLTSEDLWRLTQRLYQAGVRRVTGQLLVSQWRFGPVECRTVDRCAVTERSDNAYSALLSSSGVNYGSWCVQVAPGAVGGPARVTDCNAMTPLMGISNTVTTQGANGATGLVASRVQENGTEHLRVAGKITINELPQEIYRASADPAAQTATILGAMLELAGIKVEGGHGTTSERPPSNAIRLAAVDGKPLQELLLRMLNYSNNYMADVMALDLVDEPQAQLDQAGETLEAFAAEIPGHGPVTLESGSGLTTGNKTSAQGVNSVLEYMYGRSELFPVFAAGLQAPTNGPMRHLRRGSQTFQSHVMVKTGTLNQPVAVRALSGYFRTTGQRWGVFTVLVNGTSNTPYLSWSRVLDLVSLDLDQMISQH
ncbi:D-alanyl-D-alanine carboxypeptidase/D-alanyl-D-alanine-endopeptidase [Halomonas binhaiensis]|nr:D-alanyl-D-alanine carboxypeptidase/D-alanyl-D-alanine-endopeptidase [Halomonas binhaiensis]